MDSIETKDGRIYKIERELFSKYSDFYRTMIQDTDDEVFFLPTIHSTHFDFIYEFMQLHRHQDPKPLAKLHPGVLLPTIMEEADAELIQRIFSNPPEQVKLVIDAAFLLHIDHLLKRLAAGMIAGLQKQETKKLVEESRKSALLEESEVSSEIQKKIQLILLKEKEVEVSNQQQEEC